jgi:hypothetical protein
MRTVMKAMIPQSQSVGMFVSEASTKTSQRMLTPQAILRVQAGTNFPSGNTNKAFTERINRTNRRRS